MRWDIFNNNIVKHQPSYGSDVRGRIYLVTTRARTQFSEQGQKLFISSLLMLMSSDLHFHYHHDLAIHQ